MWKSIVRSLSTCYRYFPCLISVHLCIFTLLAVPLHEVMCYRLPMYHDDTPTNVTYYRGERAILQCHVSDLGTKQIIWKRANSNHALTIGELVFVNNKNIGIEYLPHREEWNLVITDVQPKHSGLYECQISTKEDLKRYIQLNVRKAPMPRNEAIKITGKEYVEKGNKIMLTCNATGDYFPPEDIDWFKDGTKVKQNQDNGINIVKFRVAETKTLHSQLEIDHSDMTDSGNYICRSSDLAITSMNVMVLNGKLGPKNPRSKDDKYTVDNDIYLGSAKRSRKKIEIAGAGTNPIKRDNEPSQTEGSSSSSTNRANSTLPPCKSLQVIIATILTILYISVN